MKVCERCGKTEQEARFTEGRRVCNFCRVQDNKEFYSSPAGIYHVWLTRNKEKTKIYKSGKDPCIKCKYDTCAYCGVYYLKRQFVLGDSPEGKLYLTDFVKNLLAFITNYYNNSNKTNSKQSKDA